MTLEPSFVIVLGFLGFLSGRSVAFAAAWVVLGFGSILVHELGHALAYRAFGVAPSIRFTGFGGLTYGSELPPGRSLVVAAAGPLSGIALGTIVWLVTTTVLPPRSYEIAVLVVIVLFMNLGWSLFNLLPILPLDGSHIALAILRRLVPGRAESIGVAISLVLAVAVAVVAYLADEWYIAGFLLLLAVGSWQARSQLNAGPRDREVMAGWARLGRGEVDPAIEVGRSLAADRRTPKETAFRALELVAWGELVRGDDLAARAAFGSLGEGAVGSELLRRTFGVIRGDPPGGLAAALRGWRSATVLGVVFREVMRARALPEVVGEAKVLDAHERADVLFLIAIGLREAGFPAESSAVRAELSATDVATLGSDPTYDVLGQRAAAVIAST